MVADEGRVRQLSLLVVFFLLAAFNARAVPFFAVAAGPALALNLQDWLRRREQAGRPLPRRWSEAARPVSFLVMLALLVAVWPGWLQGTPYERRQWAAAPDPSAQRVADQLNRWRQEGRLGPDQHGFPFSPEGANTLAWCCPGEKSWLDARLGGPSEAAQYVAVRSALLGANDSGYDWRSALRENHVDHLILHVGSDYERLARVYQKLLQNPGEWPLLLIEGHTLVFGWRDPRQPAGVDPFAGRYLDLGRLAFRPPPDKQAPAAGPGPLPQPPEWWDAFLRPRVPRSPDRDEAALHLIHFDMYEEAYRSGHASLFVTGLPAGAVGVGAAGTLGSAVLQGLDGQFLKILLSRPQKGENDRPLGVDALTPRVLDNYLYQQDDGPPELLYLAIRAARRALHDVPDDPQTYLVLGQAYLRLARKTRERVWEAQMTHLARLRLVQAAAALNQAVALQPDLLQAHADLVSLYQGQGLKDLALKHLKEMLRLSRARGSRLDGLAERVRALEVEVSRLRDNYEVNAGNLKGLERARLAVERGLPGTALEVLLGLTDVAGAAGPAGVQLELELLLTAGRVREVREWVTEDYRKLLGPEVYEWVQAQVAAACGDYDRADASLDLVRIAPQGGDALPLRGALAQTHGQMLLEKAVPDSSVARRILAAMTADLLNKQLTEGIARLRRQASADVVRGLLALERGDAPKAEERFREALAVWQSEEEAARGSGLDFSGRPAAQAVLPMLTRRP
jgi:tetratricopeptide (TPR) repeat protein